MTAEPSLWPLVLGGGDDYELLVAGPAALAAEDRLCRVGRVEAGEGVVILDEAGRPVVLEREGWRHFADAGGA